MKKICSIFLILIFTLGLTNGMNKIPTNKITNNSTEKAVDFNNTQVRTTENDYLVERNEDYWTFNTQWGIGSAPEPSFSDFKFAAFYGEESDRQQFYDFAPTSVDESGSNLDTMIDNNDLEGNIFVSPTNINRWNLEITGRNDNLTDPNIWENSFTIEQQRTASPSIFNYQIPPLNLISPKILINAKYRYWFWI